MDDSLSVIFEELIDRLEDGVFRTQIKIRTSVR